MAEGCSGGCEYGAEGGSGSDYGSPPGASYSGGSAGSYMEASSAYMQDSSEYGAGQPSGTYTPLEQAAGAYKGAQDNPFAALSSSAFHQIGQQMSKDYMKACPSCGNPMLTTMSACPKCGK